MQYRRGEGFEYLRKYPGLKKWIRTCICCGSTGYDPDLPEKLTRNWGQGEFATQGLKISENILSPCVSMSREYVKYAKD